MNVNENCTSTFPKPKADSFFIDPSNSLHRIVRNSKLVAALHHRIRFHIKLKIQFHFHFTDGSGIVLLLFQFGGLGRISSFFSLARPILFPYLLAKSSFLKLPLRSQSYLRYVSSSNVYFFGVFTIFCNSAFSLLMFYSACLVFLSLYFMLIIF